MTTPDPRWDVLLNELVGPDPGLVSLKADYEAMKAALEQIAKQPTERLVNDLHMGPTMYPEPNAEAVAIARAALHRTKGEGE